MKTGYHVRSQNEPDDEKEKYAMIDTIDFTDHENPLVKDTARQEHKKETDVNFILGRFGLGSQFPGQFGEVDYNIDLQAAYAVTEEVEAAHSKLPPSLRKKYPSWEHVLTAINNGTFEAELKLATTPPRQPQTVEEHSALRRWENLSKREQQKYNNWTDLLQEIQDREFNNRADPPRPPDKMS